MYINLFESSKREQIKDGVLVELKKCGVKAKPKRFRPSQGGSHGCKFFKVALTDLPTQKANLPLYDLDDYQVNVPKLVPKMCSLILMKVVTEGLFRVEGAKTRQGQFKAALDRGEAVEKLGASVHDIAALLKVFFRELPEPLIPYAYHELFLESFSSKDSTEALLLVCLLLHEVHLDTLMYMLQFFQIITQFKDKNKMDSHNIAAVMAPNIFPIDTPSKANTVIEIIQILIDSAGKVGTVPKNILETVGSSDKVNKKKRRSGSLTRMFSGLKKIVGGKSENNHNVVTPDLLLTPINRNVMKKRKLQSNGISAKKKKDVLNKLPDNVLLSTPFTPCRTPVSMDLSGRQKGELRDSNEMIKEKKSSQWFLRSKSLKNLKQEEDTRSRKATTKTALERRWSAINPSNHLKKTKKRNSFSATPSHKIIKEVEIPEPDYIRVSKTEYEAIKNRVSAMERRISMELDNVQSQIHPKTDNSKNEDVDTNIQNVQTVYEQTLVSAQLSPTTDQLAKRLSRELKIRRSTEHKIIRSPSARKIGSMRRKSRELDRNSTQLTRHQSWHVPPRGSIPRVSLKRGKPNSVSNGLPTSRSEKIETQQVNRSQSVEVDKHSLITVVSCNLSGSSSDTWVSAEGFFTTKKNEFGSSNGRASLARLRNQNAGMVLAKAKLFDKLSDSESSNSLTKSIPRTKVATKIGSTRNNDSRLSYRVRNLKYEERRIGMKSMSPRRRNGHLSQKHKIQIAKQYLNSSGEKNNSDKENIPKESNIEKSGVLSFRDYNGSGGQNFSSPKYSTPRVPPHIKKPLNVRSPKRLCRTPGAERGTPLKVLKTPLQRNM